MTDIKHTPDDGLTEHFRQHTGGEPPASLDAFILATAHREAPKPRPGLWHRWLQACQQPRWQMAFATVAGVALMIGVVTRTQVPTPELSTASYSAAPQEFARPAPAPAAPTARIAMAPQAESLQIQADIAQAPVAKLSKRAAVALPPLELGLQEIVHLREAGESRMADQKLLELHERFPGEDLPGRLEALRQR